jgi:hypothetical protein
VLYRDFSLIKRVCSKVNDESENEDQAPPPRKRQRAAAKSGKKVVRKKQVRGKQGGLAGLINMPIDIFTEVSALFDDFVILFIKTSRLHLTFFRLIS